MTFLLDSSVLISLLTTRHVHHGPASQWLAGHQHRVATCPITQGAFVRVAVRAGQRPEAALAALLSLTSQDRHEFWADELGYADVRFAGVIGHRQVTDAYLAALARTKGGRVATFDLGLAALHGDVAELVAVGG